LSDSTIDKSPLPIKLKGRLFWFDSGLNQQSNGIRFPADDQKNIWAQPVWIVGTNPGGTEIRSNDIDYASADAVAQNTIGLATRGFQYLYDPVLATWDRQRNVTTFKTLIDNTANNATVWTPAGGKKYRVMGGIISLSKDAACAGSFQVGLTDSAGGQWLVIQISHAALVATGQVMVVPFQIPGNGYLSPTAGNLLQATCSGALTAGSMGVTVWGTEE